jgi:hypothetical protein
VVVAPLQRRLPDAKLHLEREPLARGAPWKAAHPSTATFSFLSP